MVHILQRETYPFYLKFTGLRFEVEQASRGLSAIAELLVDNYKRSFLIVLIVVVDANYTFTAVDIDYN